MTLACEDGNSKLVEVVTVVDVDDEKHYITDLVALLRLRSQSSGEILKLKFGHEAKFCSEFEHKFWSRV